MKILITGSSGYFAWELIRQLRMVGHEVHAVSSDVSRAKRILQLENINYISNDELLGGFFDQRNIDIIIHGAFCRKSDGKLLLQSLQYSRDIFRIAVESKIKRIINLSSQSVYGNSYGDLKDETNETDPGYLYALAKGASEILLDGMADSGKGITYYTNLRLASLMGPSYTVPKNVLYKFIISALEENVIKVIGGEQKFSFLDVRDAAAAIVKLTEYQVMNLKNCYNLGPRKQVGILKMAGIVRKIASLYTGKLAGIELVSENIPLNTGMNSSLLYSDLDWEPQYSFEDTVEDTIRFILQKQ